MEQVDKIDVDFGIVPCDRTLTKSVKIKNNSSIDQNFKVEKSSNWPTLDNGFQVQPHITPLLKPGEEFTFTVKFTPKLFNIKCCDLFKVSHSFGIQAELITKAITTGPECSLSCRKVKISCPANQKKYSKQLDLVNSGQCKVFFQFVIDNDHPVISIQPQQGCVTSSKQIHIIVTYIPKDKRPYFKRVCCLIANHEPILLDVYAVWLKSKDDFTWNINLDCISYANGYDCFMYDIVNRVTEGDIPLISMSKSYINFGHCQPKGSKKIEFSLTNNTDSKLNISWVENKLKKVFTINPPDVEVEPHTSIMYCAEFKPLVADMLYGIVLEALVQCDGYLLPFPVQINLKGDSFKELSCGWVPQYHIEPVSFDKCEEGNVVLPPIITNSHSSYSYATMVIHRRGHLPLAFQFHPPTHTNYSVKPQQGLINEGFQIVVIRYNAETPVEAIVTERWLLTFNSNETVNPCIVKFGCSVETPRIIINQGKDIVFPSVHPGTQYELFVNLFNPTRLFLKYDLEVVRGTCILVIEKEGEIWPQEHKWVPFLFQPKSIGCLESLLKCNPHHEFGKPTSVVIRSFSSQTVLEAEPKKLLFQNVIRDFKHERSFKIINIGEAIINGILTWDRKENEEDFEVVFEPESFMLEPGDSITVEIALTPFTVGRKELMVYYRTTIPESTFLLELVVDSLFPALQIADIRINSPSPLFAKFHYWKMMQLNKLNEMLQDARPAELSELYMYLPSFACSDRDTILEMLVENESEMGTTLSVRPVVNCDCQPVLRQVSFSISKWDRNCPHRKQVEIVPEYTHVQAKSYTVLTMTVSYNTVGNIDSHFMLSFIPEDYEEIKCEIKLIISRTSIAENEPFVDTTEIKENGEFVFKMRPVYIGDANPIAQGFHLYNNTKNTVNFEVDDKNLFGTPFKYLRLSNQIPFFSNQYLLFTFLPYCSQTYEAEVILLLNNNPQKLILRGEGFSSPNPSNIHEVELPRDEKLNRIYPSEVFLSKSHIDIGPIKSECTFKCVFFIINNTKDLISFKFPSTKLNEIIKLRVHPSKGILKPESVVECRLTCLCLGLPCHLSFSLVCTYTNFSRYLSIVRSLENYYKKVTKVNKYFVITEKGTQGYYVSPPNEEWPLKNHVTIGFNIDLSGALKKCQEEDFMITPLDVTCDTESYPELYESRIIRFIVVDVLERLLWQAVNEEYYDCLKGFLSDSSPPLRYVQFRKSDKSGKISVPENIKMTVLEELIYITLQDCFNMDESRNCEKLRRNIIRQLQCETKIFRCFSPRNSMTSIPTVTSLSLAASASLSIGTVRSDSII